jgi:CRP-like cAMP-binding protein
MSDVATLESKDEVKDDPAFVRMWMDAIQIAGKQEETWRKQADETVKIYRAGSKSRMENPDGGDRAFNILFANVETVVPTVYNSTPIPDVRRRYDDEDKVGKQVSDLIERAISYSVDSYDFDHHIKFVTKDMELVGRGGARVRYTPYFDDKGEVVHEEANCEHFQWKDFRHGPGNTWDDVPWVAFQLKLTRAELRKLNKKLATKIELDACVDGYKDEGETPADIFKRATVWEIWDKDGGEVIFIAESYKQAPLVRDPDPLGLSGFFPLPRPAYAIECTDSLTPVIPYSTYRDQAEELEKISRRIMALVEACKARGIYDGRMTEVPRLSDADDNELIAVESAANYLDGAGLEKAIAWWPIETISRVLKELYLQREQIKQTIYEITGLSDILRGQTDPNETLGAQELKAQTGSMRVQTKQAEIQRFARDLFRLKAEIIATKFSWETITAMTGINFPAQAQKQAMQQQMQMAQQQAQATGQQPPPVPPEIAKMMELPTREEVEQVLRNDTMRGYRIDVESDSTIRADMTRNQNNMNLFLQGTAQYASAMGPIVQLDPQLMPTVIEVYSAFARTYKLGKQAEDALDKLSDTGKKMAENPAPKPPDPKIEAEKLKAEAAKQKADLDAQAQQQKMQAEQQKAQMEMQALQQKHQMELEKMQADLQMQREEIAIMREKMGMEMQVAQQKNEMEAERMERESAMQERSEGMAMEAAEHKHTLGMEMMDHKAKMAKKPEKKA